MNEREISFRGKRVDNGEWVYGDVAHSIRSANGRKPHKSWIVNGYFSDGGWLTPLTRHAVIDESIGQYTGVTDKNDKKIFEHDIVRIAVGGIYANHVVSYDKENARFVVGDIDFSMVRIFSPKIEVIGNIHDNPELLEGDL